MLFKDLTKSVSEQLSELGYEKILLFTENTIAAIIVPW